jgi:hypothetical protein
VTLSETLGLGQRWERRLVRLLQAGLVGLVLYGLATFRLGMAANGALALSVTLLPAALRREYGYTMDAGLVLWITLAIVLHVAGSLGVYAEFSWYDEITHTVSATVVAGAGYAALRAVERHSSAVEVPPPVRSAFVVVFVLSFGVVWEVFEFGAVELSRALGLDSPVTVYGIDDIVTDFVFNTVGAVLVALWGADSVGGFVAFLGRRLGSNAGE